MPKRKTFVAILVALTLVLGASGCRKTVPSPPEEIPDIPPPSKIPGAEGGHGGLAPPPN